jgi:3-isopropylmalate dehydrogenase
MMLRYSFNMLDAADAVEKAVEEVLNQGYRTGDIHQGTDNETKVNTAQMGDAILKALNA